MIMKDRTTFIAGVANHRSIAWSIAKAIDAAGGRLALGYLGDREREGIEKIVDQLERSPMLVHCDVNDNDSVQAAFDAVGNQMGHLDSLLHAIAFAKREDLDGRFKDTSRDGFELALGVSAYSLNVLTQAAEPLMKEGSSIVALTFLGSERAVPNYNVMGVAKAALEASVRYLARDLGPQGIRVNALSAGPLKTLASRGIKDFPEMLRTHAERSAMKRNVTVEEVGQAGLFLCSPMSSGMTGDILYVDAGYRFMAG